MEIDEIVLDLRAAVRLGREEALDLALASLGEWEDFRANRPLSREEVLRYLVPLGLVLAADTVPLDYVAGLAEERLAGAKAIAAAALIRRYAAGDDGAKPILLSLLAEHRAEIRFAIVEALPDDPFSHKRLLELVASLLTSPPLKPEEAVLTALAILPRIARHHPGEACKSVVAFRDKRPKVQQELGKALRECAAKGAGKEVLETVKALLEQKTISPDAAIKSLRGRWSPPLVQERLSVLNALEAKVPNQRLVHRTRAEIQRSSG